MFKVVWDKEYNGVRLTQSPQGEALNVSPRPVFFEELDFLKMDDYGWKYPRCKEPLLWACERRYFYCGELVLEVHGGNIFDAPSVEPKVKKLSLKPVDMERLRDRNEDAMFIIEHEAMNFIDETYHRYRSMARVSEKNPDIDFQQLAERQTKQSKEEHVVVKEDCDSFDIMPLSEAERQGKKPVLSGRVELFIASFSGGKDSAVVLDLVSRVVPPEDFLVVYSDTGYELPTSLELYEEVQKHYHKSQPDLRFFTARNHQPVLYYWNQMGSPSRIHRWCCAVMKTAPLYRLLKDLNGKEKQPYTLAFEGVRGEESETRSSYDRIGKGVKHNNVINARPIFDWSVVEVWLYIFFNGLPINAAYRRGLNRVGCVLCPLATELGDCLDNMFFPDTARPFINKLREISKENGVKNIDSYIKERKWKVRAGGNNFKTESSVTFSSTEPSIDASVLNPKENLFEWIKTLGKVKHTDSTSLSVKYGDRIYSVKVDGADTDNISISIPNASSDLKFVGHIKRVLNKTAHCVHCEVCEVECPTGALTIVPHLRIDENKCIHCHKCLDFIDMGCEVANSLKKTTTLKDSNMTDKKTPVNSYNTFGFRQLWLSSYFNSYTTFFEGTADGAIPTAKQMPMFKRWLKDAEIISDTKGKISSIGELLASAYNRNEKTVLEINWINLCNNMELMDWFINTIAISKRYEKNEIDLLFADSFPTLTKDTRTNAMKAFLNTLKESPYGDSIPVGVVELKGNNVTGISRRPHNDLSLTAVAYSLYRYAESVGRWSLTVSEFYNENQREGIYRQFGIERDVLERKLRSLQEEGNHVLSVELAMGLDNILLRQDLNSLDILKMLL